MTESRAVTFPDLSGFKRDGRKIVVLTCYDALFARLLDDAVDVLLVGDSVHQVLGGHETTLGATLDQMIYHGAAVRRGSRHALVVVDLPFLTYQVSIPEAIRNSGRILQETGAHGVKLEGGRHLGPTVTALVQAGIPVMGHLGLTPAVGQRPGWIQGAGPGGRRRPRAARGRTRARGGGRFGPGAGAGSPRPRGAGQRRDPDPDHRHRRRTGVRWPGARPPRHAGIERGILAPLPQALRRVLPRRCGKRRSGTPPRCAAAPFREPEQSFE